MSDDVEPEDIEDIINELARLQQAKMFVGAIGRVLAYDVATQKVRVQLVVRGSTKGGESVRFPPVSNVPVVFPSGGGYSMTWPLIAGDTGWVAFGDRSIDEWLSTGAEDVTPSSKRRFAITDAVFFPGLRPYSAPHDLADGDELVIGQDQHGTTVDNGAGTANPLQLRIGPDGIRLGDGGATNDVLNVLFDALGIIDTALGGAPLAAQLAILELLRRS